VVEGQHDRFELNFSCLTLIISQDLPPNSGMALPVGRDELGKLDDYFWRPIMKFINKLFRDEAGATAIEYGLIAALIAVAIMSTVTGLGSELNKTFSKTSSQMASANA